MSGQITISEPLLLGMLRVAWENGARTGWLASGEGFNSEYPDEGVPWKESEGYATINPKNPYAPDETFAERMAAQSMHASLLKNPSDSPRPFERNRMTPKEPMKPRTIRETDAVWEAVVATADDNGEDASTVTRQFWRKYAKVRIAEEKKKGAGK